MELELIVSRSTHRDISIGLSLMAFFDDLPTFKTGTWMYAGVSPVRIKIIKSPVTMGSGDYEDPDEIADGQEKECFFAMYESAGSPGCYNNVIPNFETIEIATLHIEQLFPGAVWDDK